MPFSDLIGHERPTALLKAAMRHERVAHAYLFFGEEGIGKRLAAIRFAQAVNCDVEYGAEGPDACGACRSCRQTESYSHPDFIVIEPDRERTTAPIKIEQIRELEHHLIYRPLIGRRRVCLIDRADRMNLAAANALLKTLEEPPTQSLFLLITSRPLALPATVRSRCQALRFSAPARTQVEAALILKRELPPDDARLLAMVTESRIGEALRADVAAIRVRESEMGALTARTTLESIPHLLTAAEATAKAGRAEEALDWIAGWVRNVLLLRVGADPDSVVRLDPLQGMRDLPGTAPVDGLLDVMDLIEAAQRAATRNVNLHLALEGVLLRLRDTLYPDQPGAHSVHEQP